MERRRLENVVVVACEFCVIELINLTPTLKDMSPPPDVNSHCYIISELSRNG